MTLEFTVDPELTESLREEILDCWTEVSQAGGAVGFVPPVSRAEVAPVAEASLDRVASGQDRLIVGRVPGGDSVGGAGVGGDGIQGAAPGRLAALAFVADDQVGLSAHWRMVKRVMIHPDFQGSGYGVGLMDTVAQVGRSMGLEMLSLDCRGGTGVELFYKKCGYLEWGRMPRALRITPDDYREKICLYLPL